MSDDADPPLSVDAFVDYCRTQIGLLSGRVETIHDEADELLDDIDAEMAAIRSQLEGGAGDVEGTAAPPSTDQPGDPDSESDLDVTSVEEFGAEIERKQALVEAKHARIHAFQELAAGYTDLLEELQSVDDGREAMERVVRFEADHDAPAYFDDRQTVLEAATGSDESGSE